MAADTARFPPNLIEFLAQLGAIVGIEQPGARISRIRPACAKVFRVLTVAPERSNWRLLHCRTLKNGAPVGCLFAIAPTARSERHPDLWAPARLAISTNAEPSNRPNRTCR